MHLVWSSVWIGAVVACVLKLGSPHRNPLSWVVAMLVGGAGGVLGLFVARMVGFGSEQETATYVVVSGAAATMVLLWAGISRYAWRPASRRRTRPTIVF